MNRSLILFFLFLSIPLTVLASPALSGGVDGHGPIQSAIPMEHKVLTFSLGFEHSNGDALNMRNMSNGVATSKYSLASKAVRQNGMFALSYGLFPFLETSLYVPYYRDEVAFKKGDETASETSNDIGNIKTSLKFNYPPYPHKRGFEISYLLQLEFPSGSKNNPYGFIRNRWNQSATDQNAYGNDEIVTTLKLLTTANFGAIDGMFPLHLHLNWGLVLAAGDASNVLVVDGGIDFTIKEYVSIFWNAAANVAVSHATKTIPYLKYPITHSLGAVFHIPSARLSFTTGVKLATNVQDSNYYPLTSDPSVGYAYEPDVTVFGGLTFGVSFASKDRDGDGILDDVDKCPEAKEDVDKFEDQDGCPDLDNDGDGIVDLKDKCPLKPEDRDEFEDDDGCPDLDNDNDGVADVVDKCPDEKEDIDSFDDQDGCPELDNDLDGILDVWDKCPMKAEDRDQFEDEDGCPDLDNDKDGVPDSVDKCPGKAEIVNGYLDGDGCPDTEPRLKNSKDKNGKKRR